MRTSPESELLAVGILRHQKSSYKPPLGIASQHRSPTRYLDVGPPGNYTVSVLNFRLKQVESNSSDMASRLNRGAGRIFSPESSRWQVSLAQYQPSPKEGDSFAESCNPCRRIRVTVCWALPSVRWSFVQHTTLAPRVLLDGRTVGSCSVQPASHVTWVTLNSLNLHGSEQYLSSIVGDRTQSWWLYKWWSAWPDETV